MQTQTAAARTTPSPRAPLKVDPGPRAEQRWIDIRFLKVDQRYQRDTESRRSQALIERIAGEFRWARFGVASVVRQGDVYFVVDGQHRVEAARRAGMKDVPCIILPYETVKEAAAAFVAINRDRVVVTALHLFHAELAAGSEEAAGIARACASAGVIVCRYPVPSKNMKTGETLAIGILTRLYRARGEKFLGRVLSAVVRAPGGRTPGAVNVHAIRFAADQLQVADPQDAKPAGAGPRNRTCMTCRNSFFSSGSTHRQCNTCRRRSE